MHGSVTARSLWRWYCSEHLQYPEKLSGLVQAEETETRITLNMADDDSSDTKEEYN